MTKFTYIYLFEDLKTNSVSSFESLKQLEDVSGLSYRTLQRRMGKSDVYYNTEGLYKISKLVLERDDRRNNRGNPNLVR